MKAKKTKRPKAEAREIALAGMPGPVVVMPKEVEDQLAAAERKAAKKGGKEGAAKAVELLERLRELGHPLSWPTRYRPQLCCAKRKKDEAAKPLHGVAFRRDGDHCMVEATNGRVFVRYRLRYEGVYAPHQAIVPAKAMGLMSEAEDELACVWFTGTKVAVLVDSELHQYQCIAPDLPFPEPMFERKGAREIRAVGLDAKLLLKAQLALDCGSLLLRSPRKGILALLPDGDEKSDAWGFLATVGSEAQGDEVA